MLGLRAIKVVSRQGVRHVSSTPFVSQQDLIKDMFLKELKAYKPASKVDISDLAQVKEFNLPTPPKAPKFDEDIASDLAAYDTPAVTKA
ncbi:hypothetical protein DSO57_1016865 [Entomophthora muscae]|uniref:Uncharacterized protein n=1 Tax=Entomophthora muscae TaxID=34485 RepID=A0ACC2RVY7_9FUNG|nr:hypothetical protein DSO57_1016865 [Entomophthora muscae]